MSRIFQTFIPHLLIFLLASGLLLWAHFSIEEKSQQSLVVQIQKQESEQTEKESLRMMLPIFSNQTILKEATKDQNREFYAQYSNFTRNPRQFDLAELNDLFGFSLLLFSFKEAERMGEVLEAHPERNQDPILAEIISYNLGLLYILQNDYEFAMQYLPTKLNTKYAYLTHVARSIALLNLNKEGDAFAEIALAQELIPANQLHILHFRLGNEYQSTKNFPKALLHFSKALELRPDTYQAQLNMAIVYRQMGQYDKAEEVYAKLMTDYPSYFLGAYNYGILLDNTNREREALRAYQKALLLNPDHRALREKIAKIYYGRKQFEKAMEEYNWLYKKSPSNESYLLSLADTKLQLGLLEEAISLYKLANEKAGGKSVEAWLNLGDAYWENKEKEKSLSAYESAYKLNPNNAKVLSYLGKHYNRIDQTEKALGFYLKSLELEPKSGLTLRRVGLLYDSLGQREMALKYLKESLPLLSQPYRTYRDLGDILTKEKKYQEALVYYRQAVMSRPQSDEFHFFLGRALSRVKDHKEAIKSYNKALELSDQEDIRFQAQVHTYIAKEEEAMGRLQEAKEFLLKAVELDNEYFLARVDLASLMYYKLKDKNQAAKELSLALGIKPEDCSALAIARELGMKSYQNKWESICKKP